MATAKKLPSGSWRCLVYSHSEPVFDKDGKPVLDKNGKQKQKRIYESFTSDDPTKAGKREAERQAAEFAAQKGNHGRTSSPLATPWTHISASGSPYCPQAQSAITDRFKGTASAH